jgi:hypothetical protein
VLYIFTHIEFHSNTLKKIPSNHEHLTTKKRLIGKLDQEEPVAKKEHLKIEPLNPPPDPDLRENQKQLGLINKVCF